MPPPVKNITYMDNLRALGAIPMVPSPTVSLGLVMNAMRMAAPMWKPLRLQGVAVKGGNVALRWFQPPSGFKGTAIALFWRSKWRPKRGQLWPRTR